MTRAAVELALTITLLIGASSLASCGDGGGTPIPRIPHATVKVTITEYRFHYEQPVPAGRVVFRVVNAGSQVHRVSMLALPEDLPPIAQQLRGTNRRGIVPFAEIGGLAPGTSNSFAVDLERGQRYGLIDVGASPDGTSNALLGLAAEFRAGGGPAGPRSR